MNTLLTLAVLLTLAAAWHALKRRVKEGPKARRVPSRKATMFAVVLVLGLQAIATAPAASAAACGEAPNPERPGAGMVGAIDPPEGHGEPNSAYIDYGYAGMVWNTFETNCSGLNLTPAGSTLDSWGGNQLFNLGKNIVGATNSLHYTVLEGGLLNPIYNAVKSGAEKVYNNIYAQLFGLVALILSIMMFRNIWRGDLAAVSKRALYALAGIWLAASSLAMLRYFDPIDKAIVQTTTNIQAGFVDESGDRIVRDILPTQLHTQIVYNNWLRGEFGTPTAPQAEQYGKPLLDAQAFTRNQLVNGDDGNQSVIDGKKNAYKDISTKLGPATGYFTGEAGGRTGAGFLSLGQALVYSLFQLLAKASVLLAQVLIRLFALTAPLIGLVALLHPEILRRVLKVAGGVAFNLVVLSVLAGVHALLLQAIFDAGNSLNMLTQMVLAGLITVLLFMVGRPVRRLWQMVEMSVSMVGAAVPSPGGGIFSRFKRNRTGPTPQDEFWQNVRDTDDVVDGEQRGPLGATAGGGRFRPEATIFANAQRLDHTSGASRPAAAWSGAWPGAINGGPAGALPAGGRPGSPVYGQYNPANGDPGDYVVVGAGGRPTLRGEESRRVDTSPVADRRWNDEPEPVVVPSDLRTPESGFSDYTPQDVPRTPGVRAQPRRVDPEVVAGKPVFVLYRPSRGIEVREEPRDTDQVMGR
ncbi:magnesium transporter [Amycolatopsis mongoliensis]|uniref:Magnesium transporter n=1 Tax=Amycolatopsis mongoliensis TaxID=715475 RepID=A0A9Y2JTN7_9PSEU|nr:magnesium transporter [Amycolatopsis sp. 4-36]WIY03292.1 magnesium transporter [Amycolatopsis sp. 4-36]